MPGLRKFLTHQVFAGAIRPQAPGLRGEERRMNSNTPHDLFFKKTFGRLDVAAGFLRHNLPAALVACLDLERLERVEAGFVDQELTAAYSDLLFKVPLKDQATALLIYILFEHKSSPELLTPFQILRYVVRIWERWLERQQRKTSCLPRSILWYSTMDEHPGAARQSAWSALWRSILSCYLISLNFCGRLHGVFLIWTTRRFEARR